MLVQILDEDLLKLYTLIWSRAMACQMEPAIIDQVRIYPPLLSQFLWTWYLPFIRNLLQVSFRATSILLNTFACPQLASSAWTLPTMTDSLNHWPDIIFNQSRYNLRLVMLVQLFAFDLLVQGLNFLATRLSIWYSLFWTSGRICFKLNTRLMSHNSSWLLNHTYYFFLVDSSKTYHFVLPANSVSLDAIFDFVDFSLFYLFE